MVLRLHGLLVLARLMPLFPYFNGITLLEDQVCLDHLKTNQAAQAAFVAP
jgi:hypothetical protein